MLKIIKDSTLVPTPIVDLKLDSEPRQGSTDPVTSEGVKTAIDGAVGDASAALQEQIDDIAEKAGSGYIPKGEATVATLNGLSGQENGDLYTMTDAGTLTEGSLAVVAGDTVAWDATNSVWYKAMSYAPAQYGTNEVHNLPTTITAFRTGDVIPVDGQSGTAKMSKDDLLRVTAENALSGNVAPAFDATKNYVANNVVSYGGKVYRFKVNHPAGAWDASHVDNFDLGSHFFSAMSNIANTSVYSSFNDLPNNTAFLILVDLSNSPLPADIPWGICYTIGLQGGSNCVQIMTSILSNASKSNITWTRVKRAGTWSDWKQLLSSSDTDKLFQIGGSLSNTSVYASCNDLPPNWVYLIATSSITDRPSGASTSGGFVYSFGSSTSNMVQLYTDIGSASTLGFTWLRCKKSGTWSDWKRLVTEDDIADLSLIPSIKLLDNLLSLDSTCAVTGKYINKNGTLATLSSFWYIPNAIAVPAFSKLSVIARGALTNVAIISKQLTSTTFEPLVISDGSDTKVYTWTNHSNAPVNVTICSVQNMGYAPLYKIEENQISTDLIKVSITCFDSIGCLGDSYTAGQLYHGAESLGTFNGKYSWPENLARETNINITNYGVPGASTRSAKTNSHQLPQLLTDNAKDLYILTLGLNDKANGAEYLGTSADMDTEDYTQSADTFYGNYYYIIEAIKEHAPNALVIMLLPHNFDAEDTTGYYEAAVTIAETAEIPYLLTNGLNDYQVFSSKIGGHPTIAGYSLMSRFYREIIENHYNANPSELNKMVF